MTDGHQAGLVCGFGDVAAGIAAVAWDLGEPGALLLSAGDARPATFGIEEGGDAAALSITAGQTSIEATLAPRAAEVALEDGPVATVCTAEVRSEGGTETIECFGQICRWSANPLQGAGIFRQIAVQSGEDSAVVAVARGEPSATGHGEERTGGGLIRGEDATPFEESLISTQYDSAGDPTRIGLELWPVDADQTSRAAATRVSGSLIGGVRTGGTWAGLFRCHTDGVEGLGSYLLWRA